MQSGVLNTETRISWMKIFIVDPCHSHAARERCPTNGASERDDDAASPFSFASFHTASVITEWSVRVRQDESPDANCHGQRDGEESVLAPALLNGAFSPTGQMHESLPLRFFCGPQHWTSCQWITVVNFNWKEERSKNDKASQRWRDVKKNAFFGLVLGI